MFVSIRARSTVVIAPKFRVLVIGACLKVIMTLRECWRGFLMTKLLRLLELALCGTILLLLTRREAKRAGFGSNGYHQVRRAPSEWIETRSDERNA